MYTQPFLSDLKGHSVFLQILVSSDYFHLKCVLCLWKTVILAIHLDLIVLSRSDRDKERF